MSGDPAVEWRPGDRVQLSPTGTRTGLMPGTVREVTERGGVVDLDWKVRGVDWCTAFPKELTRTAIPRRPARTPNGRPAAAPTEAGAS